MTTDREALVKQIDALLTRYHNNVAEWLRAEYPRAEALRAERESLKGQIFHIALTAQGGEQTADTVSVPREPTEEMLIAGNKAIASEFGNKRTVTAIYKTMLAAAKEGK